MAGAEVSCDRAPEKRIDTRQSPHDGYNDVVFDPEMKRMEIGLPPASPSKPTSLALWARIISATIVLLLAVFGLILPMLDHSIRLRPPIAPMFLLQDLPVVPAILLIVLTLQPQAGRVAWRAPPRWSLGLAIALLVFCWWGHYGVLSSFDLSRDEQMADFDAAIFRSGHLFAAVPAAWRRFVPAMDALYVLPVGGNAAWVSDYLPGNAALRALVGIVADPSLTSPLLVGVGLLALHRVTFRLWPDSPGSRATALLCYAGSSQVLVCGMSSYAMSAHLAFDLLWLALFLRADRRGMAGAILVAFVATGLHQPLFHPLFAIPFLILEASRDRRRFIVYVLAYAVIGTFWLAWPHFISNLASSLPPGAARPPIGFFDRFRGLLTGLTVNSLWLPMINLLRFVTWQHPLLLPLAIVGCGSARRSEPMVISLIAGILLPFVIATLLVPDAGYGWGYRYLHGVIGNACLLAGYGWHRFERAGANVARAMLIATLGDLVLLIPVHCWMAHRMTQQQSVLDGRVQRTQADMIVIDHVPLAEDLVINRADMSNRPLRFLSQRLSAADIAILCHRGSIAFADGDALGGIERDGGRAGINRTTIHQTELENAASGASCDRRPFPAV